jgi:flagellar biogenesis protein FliO
VKPETTKADTAKTLPVKASEKIDSAPSTDSEKFENQPVLRADRHKGTDAIKLGGARPGPSAIRSFLAMLLVVGGLGVALLYVKKKKASPQAKKVGDSWISNLLAGNNKKKSLIEVVAVHPLGPKQSITVVRIRGQQLVLGVTEGNVQLITQLDSDDEIDLMDDPKVADSIGKIFGGKPAVQPIAKQVPMQRQTDASFGSLLKNSSGAGAIVARNAYQAQSQSEPAPRANLTSIQTPVQTNAQPSVRDQIKQRLQQGMRN